MAVTIKTNHHERPVLHGWDLTAEERREFDYYEWPDSPPQHPKPTRRGEDAEFVRYHGRLYDLNDTEGVPHFTTGWDMYISDSFFSGILFRFAREPRWEGDPEPNLDPDFVVCATFYVS